MYLRGRAGGDSVHVPISMMYGVLSDIGTAPVSGRHAVIGSTQS